LKAKILQIRPRTRWGSLQEWEWRTGEGDGKGEGKGLEGGERKGEREGRKGDTP